MEIILISGAAGGVNRRPGQSSITLEGSQKGKSMDKEKERLDAAIARAKLEEQRALRREALKPKQKAAGDDPYAGYVTSRIIRRSAK